MPLYFDMLFLRRIIADIGAFAPLNKLESHFDADDKAQTEEKTQSATYEGPRLTHTV